MNHDELLAAIPHRPPFLLVDEVVERTEKRIVCRKTFREDEWFFAGHYPGFPIVPGVLLCEAAMQAGAMLLAQYEAQTSGGVPVAARLNDVRFKRMVKPGETIEMEVEITEPRFQSLVPGGQGDLRWSDCPALQVRLHDGGAGIGSHCEFLGATGGRASRHPCGGSHDCPSPASRGTRAFSRLRKCERPWTFSS